MMKWCVRLVIMCLVVLLNPVQTFGVLSTVDSDDEVLTSFFIC